MGHTTHLRGMANSLRMRTTISPPAVAVMDSCFVLVRTHQHRIAVGPLYDPKAVFGCPLLPRRVHLEFPLNLLRASNAHDHKKTFRKLKIQ